MKERFWDRFQSWTDAEAAWDERAANAAQTNPLNAPTFQPSMPAIAPGEGPLRWKALRWVIRKDGGYRLISLLLRRPFRYLWMYLRSVIKKKPYHQEGDFCFYGARSIREIEQLMRRRDALLIVGFSYCQKPHECPCGRFSDGCTADLSSPICQQCLVGKAMHALPHSKTIPIIIPTVNAIGEHVLEVIHAFPKHKVLFIITACPMALEMFGDFGNMVGIQGVGVRLSGRVWNTMRAFALSEEGVKPGLTVVTPSAQSGLFHLLRYWKETCCCHDEDKA